MSDKDLFNPLPFYRRLSEELGQGHLIMELYVDEDKHPAELIMRFCWFPMGMGVSLDMVEVSFKISQFENADPNHWDPLAVAQGKAMKIKYKEQGDG